MTVTEMRYVRTLKALSPALVKLVTKEMARSVEVILKSALMYLITNQLVGRHLTQASLHFYNNFRRTLCSYQSSCSFGTQSD